MPIDMEEQYDRLYRYCYFRLRSQEAAEDVTQEAFLRYLEKYQCATAEQAMKCLYTIARNLCVDEYRRRAVLPPPMLGDTGEKAYEPPDGKAAGEERILTSLAVRAAVAELESAEQELLLLRYVNEVPVGVLAQILGISRFAVRRRLAAVSKKFKERLGREGF